MLRGFKRSPGTSGGQEHLLGVDLGATNTVALLRGPDGQIRPLLFGGEPFLPSNVLVNRKGGYLVGREAARRAAEYPDGFEAAPRRRITEAVIRLGDREVEPAELLAAVLGAVAKAAVGAVGHLPPAVFTHPAAWGPAEQAVLRSAAERAGFGPVALVVEPVAAAYTRPSEVGARVLVVDAGARAFDVSLLRRETTGFVVTARGGDRALGGRRVDAAIAAHLAATSGATGAPRREVWGVIDNPADTGQRRAQRAFWDEVRAAKEMLSRAEEAAVLVPGLAEPITLTAEDLGRLARPVVDQVTEAARKIATTDLDAVLLTGGSSRLAELPTALAGALGRAPEPVEQPELTVAEGALIRFAETFLPAPVEPSAPVPVGSRSLLWPMVGAGAALLVVIIVLLALFL